MPTVLTFSFQKCIINWLTIALTRTQDQ